MEIKQLNEILENLQNPDSKKLKLVSEKKGHIGIPEDFDEGNQGEYNEFHRIYQVIKSPEIFMQITYQTDSYGSNEFATAVKFVTPKKKEVTVYE